MNFKQCNILVELVLLVLYVTESGVAQYEWSCTQPDESGQRYVPSVRDRYRGVATAGTAKNQLNIYRLPDDFCEACYGKVVGIEYCYKYNAMGIDYQKAVFNWTVLILKKQDMSGASFTVIDKITIESHSATCVNCTKHMNGYTMCCDVTRKINKSLDLSENFIFGVTGPSPGNTHQATLLRYHETELPQYTVSATQLSVVNQNISVGSNVSSVPVVPKNGLRMLWFIIETNLMSSGLLSSGASPPLSDNTNCEDNIKDDPDQTSRTGSRKDHETSESSKCRDQSKSQPKSRSKNTMSKSTESPKSMSVHTTLSQTVGGVIGGLFALAMIISAVVVVSVWMITVRKRHQSKKGAENCYHDTLGYDNAVYDATSEGAVIPIKHVRFEASTTSEQHYEYGESGYLGHEYSLLEDSQDLLEDDSETTYPTPVLTLSQSYYQDEDIYMAPASDEYSLYSQLSQIKIHTFNRDAIVLSTLLGSGQFGAVHRGKWLEASGSAEGSSDVAVKTLKKGADGEDKVKFLQEAAIMGQFSHPNVVELYGVITEGEPVMLIIELLPKGDLRSVLCNICSNKDSDFKIDADLPHTLLSFCRQVASGMSYLAGKSFVHRDLAARNILVSEDGVCKIADFGMSRDLADTDYYISHGGIIPVKWTAPEALNYKRYSTASDVWSFGCVMYEIWSLGHKPFEKIQNQEYIGIVNKGARLAPPPGCPRTIYKVMIDCWHPNSSDRPNFVSIVQQLFLPDTKLLKWSDEDKGAADEEASILGAGLDKSVDLYKDLQEQYSKN